MKYIHFLILIFLLLLMQGCQILGDRPGRTLTDAEIAAIPDAVPTAEPLSDQGNPESYEINGRRYNTMKDATGFVQHGIASWYGKKFHGRRTSNGEKYDMYGMTAAHKTLPLPTYVRVTNLANDLSVVVRVNDRGPFTKGRAIDLSYAAARKLGIFENGTAEVEIRALTPGGENNAEVVAKAVEDMQPLETIPIAPAVPVSKPPSAITGTPAAMVMPTPSATDKTYYLQVGAFSLADNAQRLELDMQQKQDYPVLTKVTESQHGVLYRVRIGPFNSREDLIQVQHRLQQLGHDQFRQVVE